MKMNTLEKLYLCMRDRTPEITVDADYRARLLRSGVLVSLTGGRTWTANNLSNGADNLLNTARFKLLLGAALAFSVPVPLAAAHAPDLLAAVRGALPQPARAPEGREDGR